MVGALAASASAQDVVTVLWPPASVGTVDTFESYADNAALDAVYGGLDFADGTGGGVSTEQNNTAAGTKSLKFNTSNDVNANLTAPAQDSLGTTIESNFYFYDTAGATSAASRHGFSLASYANGVWNDGALNNMIVLGNYTSLVAGFYSTRVVSGTPSGYEATTVARTVGWHKMQIRMKNGTVEFYIDDTLGLSKTYTKQTTAGWNSFRMGDFVASTNNITTFFDDVSVVRTVDSGVSDWHLY